MGLLLETNKLFNSNIKGGRIFSLLSILSLGISLILFFAYFTYISFVEGVNSSLWLTMGELANIDNVSPEHPVSFLAFTVASNWQDIPIEIQSKFPSLAMQLHDIEVVTTKKHLFELPSEVYIVSLLANDAGEPRYVSYFTTIDSSGTSHILRLLIVVIIAIMAFSSLVIATFYYQRGAIKHLRDWAKSFSADSSQKTPPDFNYDELNTLADIIYSSIKSVQKASAREHYFLRNASHELRTPIAVINSNLALLNKMKQANKPLQQQQLVLDRILRANSSMLHITETLLWLSRKDDRSVTYKMIRLDLLVESMSTSLKSLLHTKQVTVQLDTIPSELKLPIGATEIVIANLLRNAFQHTESGKVTVKQGANFINIRNVSVEANGHDHEQPTSFGLGLKLIKKLAKRFGWKYRHVIEQRGYYVEIYF